MTLGQGEHADSPHDGTIEEPGAFKEFRANAETLLARNPQDDTLRQITKIAASYTGTHGFSLCNEVAKELAQRFLLDDPFPNSSIHIWYGENQEDFTGHAVAMVRTGDREYYVDLLGYKPFQLQPGVTILDKSVTPNRTYAPKSFGKLITPPLRPTDPQMQDGKPAHNEIRIH